MKSDPATVLNWIPQDSALGPMHFVIYINYLPEVVKCGTYLFADDTKIFWQITTKGDTYQLQSDINSLKQWSEKWLLTFPPRKWHVLTLEKFYDITHIEKYTLHRLELEHFFEQKDLGIILDVELKFDEHISMEVRKENAIAGLIRRTISYLDGRLFKKLFITFVRPHLEYGQVIWTPHLEKLFWKTCKQQIGGWFSSHTLLRKTKKTVSTIVGL